MMMFMGREGRKALKEHGDVASIGIELGVSITLGAVAGDWLDGRFPFEILGGQPFLLAGLLLGLAAGCKSLYVVARKAHRELNAPAPLTTPGGSENES